MHKVRRQIQEKVEMTLTTTGKIHILDREYIGLTTSVLMQPSPETVLQLKLYKQDLDTRYLQIKVTGDREFLFLFYFLSSVDFTAQRV